MAGGIRSSYRGWIGGLVVLFIVIAGIVLFMGRGATTNTVEKQVATVPPVAADSPATSPAPPPPNAEPSELIRPIEVPNVDIEVMENQRRAKEFAETEARQRQAIAVETTEQSVGNLALQVMLAPPEINFMRDPGAWLDGAAADPRLAKLMAVARDGTAPQKAALLKSMTDALRRYAYDLPDMQQPGERWAPTVLRPGGAAAYAYLLESLDETGATLPLLVRIRQREQEALNRYHGNAQPIPIATEHGMLMARAIDRFFARFAIQNELRAGMTANQIAVVERYQAYREDRGRRIQEQGAPAVNFAGEQISILALAAQFVEAGAAGGAAQARIP